MPDAVIELDLYEPWEPPEPPPLPPGPGGTRRRLVLAAVLLAAVPLLAGARSRVALDPVLSPGFQVMSLAESGGRLFVTRPQMTTTGSGGDLQALDPRDAAPRWTRPLRQGENFVDVTDDLVLLQLYEARDSRDNGQLVAVDAQTGEPRWRRDLAQLVGRIGDDLLLVQDGTVQDEYPQEVLDIDRAAGDPEDPAVSVPMLPHHERYLVLRPDGEVAWRLELAPGTLAAFTHDDYPFVSGIAELEPSGTVRVRDPRTGAVTATHHLQLSEPAAARPVARFEPGVAGQQILFPAGGADGEVYDLASGRLLWRWSGGLNAYTTPFGCGTGAYCVYDGSGLGALDAVTGRPLWRVDHFVQPLADLPGRLVLSSEGADPTKPVDIAAVDPRTGAERWRLDGWYLATRYVRRSAPLSVYVWRPTSTRDAVIGRLDPQTGAVAVVGRGHDFYGAPDCVVAAGRLTCLAVGTLMVWARR